MHSSNTFITRLGLYNHVVLVFVFGVTLSWIIIAAGPTKHRNPRKHVIDSTNYHAKQRYRWRCKTCVQNWYEKDYAHILLR